MTAKKTIRLLSTDFDGTLIDHQSDGRCHTRLAQQLQAFKNAGGIWLINTGRSLPHIEFGLELFKADLTPDYVVVNERHLYTLTSKRWEGFNAWNHKCDQDHAELFTRCREIFEEVRKLTKRTPQITLLEEDDAGHPTGLVAGSLDQADEIQLFLSESKQKYPGFDYQRNTVYFRFSHHEYHKGAALRHLSQRLNIPREGILAIGDNYNDLSMLDGNAAVHVACPGDSVDEVRQTVRRANGYVAIKKGAAGSSEALEYYL